MKYSTSFMVGPFSSLKSWEGEAESPEDARDKGLAWIDSKGGSSLGIKSSVVTRVLVTWDDEGQTGHKVFDLNGDPHAIEKQLGAQAKAKASKPKDPSWPFKHLKKKSSWPMQGLVVGVAASVVKMPKGHRSEAANKFVERFFRVGARLAREFELNPVKVLRVAQKQIEREIPGAKAAIAEAKAAECAEVTALADDLLGQFKGSASKESE